MRGKTHRTTRLHGPHALTGGDLGESFAIILVRTGRYGAWLRHPAIQRARDSGHAAPQAPRARDELASLWLCRALPSSVSSLLLYLAQVNPAGTEFTRLPYTVLKRKPLSVLGWNRVTVPLSIIRLRVSSTVGSNVTALDAVIRAHGTGGRAPGRQQATDVSLP